MLPLIVAQATIMFGWAMVDLAAISFLGLGVQPPQADWGVMISENQTGILQGYPLPALSAGICIVVVVIAFNVLGERLFEQATDDGSPPSEPLLEVDDLTVRLHVEGRQAGRAARRRR